MGWSEESSTYEYDNNQVSDQPNHLKGSWSEQLSREQLGQQLAGLKLQKETLNTTGKPVYPLANKGIIVAVDKLPIKYIPGVRTLQMDFLHPESPKIIKDVLITPSNPDGKADVILSDMAANQSGNRIRDVEQSLDICHAVLSFAQRHLRRANEVGRNRGGVLLLKHFEHPWSQDFRRTHLAPSFRDVYYIKPDASRSESSEGYWLCRGWQGEERFGLK